MKVSLSQLNELQQKKMLKILEEKNLSEEDVWIFVEGYKIIMVNKKTEEIIDG